MNLSLPKKDLLTVVSLAFLLLAIPLTVVLLKQRQELRKRAEVDRNGQLVINDDQPATTVTDVTLTRTAPLNPLSYSFLPIVTKNFNGYSSGIVVQNPGEEEVNVVISLFSQGAVEHTNLPSQEIPAGDSFTFFLPNYDEIPDGFLGSAVIRETSTPESGKTIFAETTHHREITSGGGQKIAAAAASYSGSGWKEPAAAYYVPLLTKDYLGFSSSVTVQNIGTSETQARVTIFEDGGASPIEVTTDEIPSGSMRVVYLPNELADKQNFIGSATVESLEGQPLVVAVSTRAESGAGEMLGVYLAADRDIYLSQTRFYFPQVMKNYYGYTSGLRIQNIDGSPTTVRGTAYSLGGQESFDLGELTLDSNRAATVYLGDLPGVPDGFLGSAVFESMAGEKIFGRAAHSKVYQQPYVEDFNDLNDWTRVLNYDHPGIVNGQSVEANGVARLDATASSTFPTFYQENFFPDGSWRLEYDLTYEDVEGYGDGVVVSSRPFPPGYAADLCGAVHDRYLPTPDILQTWQGGTGDIEKFRLTFMGEDFFFGAVREANVRYDVSLEYSATEDSYAVGLRRNGVVQEILESTRPSGGLAAKTILLGNSYNQNESTPGTVCPGASNGSGNWSKMAVDKMTLSPSPRGQTTDAALGIYEAHYNRLLVGSAAKQDKAYLPLVMKNYFGWSSSVLVQNTGTQATQVRAVFRQNGVGTVFEPLPFDLEPSASYLLYLPNIGLLPNDYGGSVIFESLNGEPITAVASHSIFYKNEAGAVIGEALGTYNSLWFTQTQAKIANSADETCPDLEQSAWGDFPEVGTFTGPWTLTEGLGTKYVCGQFQKSDGRFGEKIFDTIELVADAPPTVSILPPGGESRTTVEDNGTVNGAGATLEFTAADDNTPAEELRFCYKLDATDLDPQNCGAYETIDPSEWVAEFSNLTQGDHVFYVWAKDNADQFSPFAIWHFRIVVIAGIRVDLQPGEAWVLVGGSQPMTATIYDTKGTADQSDDTVLNPNEVTYNWSLHFDPDNPPAGSTYEESPGRERNIRVFRAGDTTGDADLDVLVSLIADPTLDGFDSSRLHVVDSIGCDLFPEDAFVYTLGEPAKSLNVTLTPPGSGFYTLGWQSLRRQVLAGNFADDLGGNGNPLTTTAQAVLWSPSADAAEGDVFNISVTATDDKTGVTCSDSVNATIGVEAAYGVEIVDPTVEIVNLMVGQTQENIKAQAYRVVGGTKENVTADLYVWTEGAPSGGAGEIRYKSVRSVDQLVDFVARRRGEERIYVVARITPAVGSPVTTDPDSLLIKVYDPLSCEGGIIPDAAMAYLGDEVRFEAHPSGGSGAYTIDWSSTLNDAPEPARAFRNPAGDLVNPLADGGSEVTWVAPAVGEIDLSLLPRTYGIQATVTDSLFRSNACEMTATVTLQKRHANLLLNFRFQARLPGVVNDPLTERFLHNEVRVMALDPSATTDAVIYNQLHRATSSGPAGQVALVLDTDAWEFGKEYMFYLRGPQHVRNAAAQALTLQPAQTAYTLNFGTLPVGDFGPTDGKGRDNIIQALDITPWNDEVDTNIRVVELNQPLDTFGDINLDLILNALDYSFYSHNVKNEIRGVVCPLCPDERQTD